MVKKKISQVEERRIPQEEISEGVREIIKEGSELQQKDTDEAVELPELPFSTYLPEASEHVNMIVYGDTGAGKTHLCGTAFDFEATSPPLFIDFEGGTRTIIGKNIRIAKPSTWTEIQVIYDFLVHKNYLFKCVIVDSLTELQKKFSMGYIMGELGEETGDGYKDLGASTAPTRQDWLRSGGQMRKFIRGFRDLAYLKDRRRRCHVIMTTLEKYDEKKNTTCPELPGSLGLECGAMVDILARLSRQNISVEDDEGIAIPAARRHLLTDDYINEQGIKFMGKNRGGLLGTHMWDPSIEKIIGVWSKEGA